MNNVAGSQTLYLEVICDFHLVYISYTLEPFFFFADSWKSVKIVFANNVKKNINTVEKRF